MSDVTIVAPKGAEAISIGSKLFKVIEGKIAATAEEAEHLLKHAGCLTEEAAKAAMTVAEKAEAAIEATVDKVIKKRSAKTADAASKLSADAAALAAAENGTVPVATDATAAK